MKLINKTSLGTTVLTLLAPALGARSLTDAGDEYRQLVREHRTAMLEFQKELAELREKNAEEARAFEVDWHPSSGFVEAFSEKAEEYAGTDGAVPFLIWILQNEPAPEGELLPAVSARSLTTLLEEHATNETFRRTIQSGGFLVYNVGLERCVAMLDNVIERAPDDELKLYGVFARGVARMRSGSLDDAGREKARADFLHVLGAETGEGLVSQVEGFLFELDNLQIGMVAPDIEGEDLGGVAFKLSDYRGKVVLLDFWGDW